jgi:hypothetical protein
MRRLLVPLFVALALAVAACGSSDSGSATTASTSAVAQKPAGPACDNASLELKSPGKLTIGTDKPAYPPYFEDDDPHQRQGLRERRGLRRGAAARLRADRGELGGRALQLLLCPRPEEVRLRHQPDPELVGEVLALIRELKADGMTMLIATHEMGFAREVADEVCFLHDGAIVERGAPDAVLGAPTRPETQRFLRRLLDAGRL